MMKTPFALSRFISTILPRSMSLIPGFGHLRNGMVKSGLGIFVLYACLLLVALFRFNLFISGLKSFLYSLVLLVVRREEPMQLFRAEIVEHWIASLFLLTLLIAIPIWAYSKSHQRRLTSDDHAVSQVALAWREFKMQRVAVFGLLTILVMYGVALLCPLVAPYDPNALQDPRVTKFQPPFSSVRYLIMKKPRVAAVISSAGELGEGFVNDVIRRLKEANAVLVQSGLEHLLFITEYHVEADYVVATQGKSVLRIPIHDLRGESPRDWEGERFFFLGTDRYGRDIFSRLIYGSRISLALGLIAVLLAVTVGTLVGLLSGYFGGYVDKSLMRFVDVLLAFPNLFFILIIIALFQQLPFPRVFLIVAVLGLTSWMGISRLVRGQVLSLKEEEFVLAARALGFQHKRIILRHILPNALTPIIVNATLRIGGIILVEAALSFLNLGVEPPTASWGNIIYGGKDYLSTAWWISTFPGFAIVLTVISFNLVGDGLRDALDPRIRM